MEELLFTGGTGFLGKNIGPVLDKMYNVTTCGITPHDDIKLIWLKMYLIYPIIMM